MDGVSHAHANHPESNADSLPYPYPYTPASHLYSLADPYAPSDTHPNSDSNTYGDPNALRSVVIPHML